MFLLESFFIINSICGHKILTIGDFKQVNRIPFGDGITLVEMMTPEKSRMILTFKTPRFLKPSGSKGDVPGEEPDDSPFQDPKGS
jgi:hypothetical protein